MGNLYLVASFYDERIYSYNFRVVKAESELKVAADMLAHLWRWLEFLERSYPRDWRREIFLIVSVALGLCSRGNYDSIKVARKDKNKAY